MFSFWFDKNVGFFHLPSLYVDFLCVNIPRIGTLKMTFPAFLHCTTLPSILVNSTLVCQNDIVLDPNSTQVYLNFKLFKIKVKAPYIRATISYIHITLAKSYVNFVSLSFTSTNLRVCFGIFCEFRSFSFDVEHLVVQISSVMKD